MIHAGMFGTHSLTGAVWAYESVADWDGESNALRREYTIIRT